MIDTLPKRSKDGFVALRGEMLYLLNRLKAASPLSLAFVYTELRDIFDMTHDLETDVLADIVDANVEATEWGWDDVVLLTHEAKEAEACRAG